MPDKPSELKPCRVGICIQSDYPGSGQVMSPDWVTYNGETFHSRAALVEVARRVYLERWYQPDEDERESATENAERIVDKYLAEQAATPTQGGKPS